MLPSISQRSCCSVYKEGQVKNTFDKNTPFIQVLGVRNKESTKRAKYVFYMDIEFDKQLFGYSNLPPKWSKLAPIVDFETIDVWLALLIFDLPINRRYKYGEARVGCLFCPFSNEYEDEIIRHYYPKAYERFVNIVKIGYKTRSTPQILTSEDEFVHGAWKNPSHKISKIINSGRSDKNIKLVSEIMGLSENMAEKYFRRKCECGDKLTPLQIGMFYKTFGRFENQEDSRIPMCQKCVCQAIGITKQEYYRRILEYKQGGCNLF